MKATACVAALALLVAGCGASEQPAAASIDVATTTSTRDSGLFDELLPAFLEQTGIEVRLVVVGSGAALRMGADGDVDVLVTHAPEGELALVDAGKLVDRRPFMENHFVLVGPGDDPAGIRDLRATAAFARLAERDAPYASRADDSGTHRREQALLREVGLDPEGGWPALLRTGAGMGQTLQVAGERRAYTLSDIGTFERFRTRVDLEALSPPDASLRNLYSVLRPNPDLYPPGHLDVEGGLALADFLLSPATQARIAAFGKNPAGRPLFAPLFAPGSEP